MVCEHQQNYINGEWVDSTGTESIAVVNPATEEPIATVARGTTEDASRAAAAAGAAFDSWSQTRVDDRAAILVRIADILEEQADELTATMISEVGTPIAHAPSSQTEVAIADLRHFAKAVHEIVWEERIDDSRVWREPVGVVAALCAWNGPLRSICLKAGAALASGSTVVVKSSEVAPLTGYVFAEAAARAGLPAGVVNLVTGSGPEIGEALVEHPAVTMASLTGSVRAGSRVMELASRSMTRVSLELGGKSANLICGDADLAAAVASGMEDAFRNAGQVCGGLSRVLVPKSRLGEAEELAAEVANSYVLGDPLDPATTLGPVISEVQRDRVRGHITRAVDDGVRLITGGPEAPEHHETGFYVRPTVFSGDSSARIAQEETFGPVVTLIGYDDEDDAIAIANDSQYGLAGGIWSGDPDRARKIARRVRTGRIRINGTAINMKAPHGGFKESGIGREMGRFGIEEFLEYKAIHG